MHLSRHKRSEHGPGETHSSHKYCSLSNRAARFGVARDVWTENTMYDEFLITITVQNGWYVLSIVAIEGTKRTTFQQLPAEIDSFAALSEASHR